MCPGQDADVAGDRPNLLKGAPVQSPARIEDQAADGFLLDVVLGVLEDELVDLVAELGLELLADVREDRIDGGLARQLLGGQERRDDALASKGLGLRKDGVRDDVDGDLALGLAAAADEFLLGRNLRLAGFLRELEGRDEVLLGDLVRRALIHDHVGLVAHIDQVELGLRLLGVGRIYHELTADAPDADGTEGPVPWDVGDAERGRGTQYGQDVRVILTVGGKQDGLDLHLVEPSLGEQGADGAVGEAAREDFLLGGAPLALEIAAGELPGCGGSFTIIHGQWKKLLTGLGLGRGDGRYQDDGFAELDRDGSVGLLRITTGLDDNLLIADRNDNFLGHVTNGACPSPTRNFHQAQGTAPATD